MLLCFLAVNLNLLLSLTTLSFRILMTTFTRFSLPLTVLIKHFSDPWCVPLMTQVNSMSRAHITSPSLVERIAITHERMIEDIFREMHDLKGPPYAPARMPLCLGRVFVLDCVPPPPHPPPDSLVGHGVQEPGDAAQARAAEQGRRR